MGASNQLQMLQAKVTECTRCQELAETRTQTVFGKGNPNADIVLIGEGPGQQEDEQGIPFVGKAGQLLDNILEAMEWNLDNVYICNVLKCRPPKNRDPKPQEAKNCRQFLDLQIKVVGPKYIICLGKVASFYLLKVEGRIEDFTIGSYRKRIFNYEGKKVLCTYHPSYLLRNSNAKQEVWDDLQFFIKNSGV